MTGPLLSQLEGLFSSLSRAISWDIVHSAGIIAFKVRKHIYIFKATDALSEESLGMGALTGRINLYKLNILLMYIFIMLNISIVNIKKRFPGGSVVKNPPAHAQEAGYVGSDSWVRKITWKRKQQPTLVFLPGKSHEQRSLVSYSPWGHKVSDTTEQLSSCTCVHACAHTHTHTQL